MTTELAIDGKAPEFLLPDQVGKQVSLKSLKGRQVVLYFYPKDDTPGCTKEACDFRDSMASITRTGAVVLGVSLDGATSHQKFIDKYQLPFRLLSDEGTTDSEAARMPSQVFSRSPMLPSLRSLSAPPALRRHGHPP